MMPPHSPEWIIDFRKPMNPDKIAKVANANGWYWAEFEADHRVIVVGRKDNPIAQFDVQHAFQSIRLEINRCTCPDCSEFAKAEAKANADEYAGMLGRR